MQRDHLGDKGVWDDFGCDGVDCVHLVGGILWASQ